MRCHMMYEHPSRRAAWLTVDSIEMGLRMRESRVFYTLLYRHDPENGLAYAS